jgi:hypothetical protein
VLVQEETVPLRRSRFEKLTGIKLSLGGGKTPPISTPDKSDPYAFDSYYGMYFYNNGKVPPLCQRNWVLWYNVIWGQV